MATYKTPALYVEVTSKLPPSVTQQPTSVAIFIGHTSKVQDNDGNDITLKAINIHSLVEFNSKFGNDPGGKYLHDAVDLFYTNGGSECYIISVGPVSNAVSFTALNNGLTVSKKIPAQVLVIPDACLLIAAEYSILLQQILASCAELQDRFAILDTQLPGNNFSNDMQQFRHDVGNNALQWGAAYYPWLILNNDKRVPPSGAIAGIYTWVDNSRGVYKAPANTPVNGVKDVMVHLDNTQMEAMNIDTVEGKSVNAIKQFTGKGILVWGARTLSGNDSEWRYISVRRFITMVEQSTKESTSWVVFEPNDANTWAKVRAMIENYLVFLWREGALAGSKPEDAFFVQAGLGTTMTAIDILEGRLIVMIGLAVVRPAEFIIIRFSHKLQTS